MKVTEQRKEYQRKYYQEHKEEENARCQKYYQNHKEERKVQRQKYVQDHKEERRVYMQKYLRDHREERKIYRRTVKDKWIELLQDLDMLHCKRCGYHKCFAALDYHHLNPSKKEQAIANFMQTAITPERTKELEKTICLCCRCHRELHANIWNIEEKKDAATY